MQKKKYIVFSGHVFSNCDGDRHWIGADRLMQLCGVKPYECYIMDKKHPETFLGKDSLLKDKSLIHLHPDSQGRYGLAKQNKEQS